MGNNPSRLEHVLEQLEDIEFEDLAELERERARPPVRLAPWSERGKRSREEAAKASSATKSSIKAKKRPFAPNSNITKLKQEVQAIGGPIQRIADSLGCTRRVLNHMEHGEQRTSRPMAKKIAYLLAHPEECQVWSICPECGKRVQIDRPNKKYHDECSGRRMYQAHRKANKAYLKRKRLKLRDRQRVLLGQALHRCNWDFKQAGFQIGVSEKVAHRMTHQFFPKEYEERMRSGKAAVTGGFFRTYDVKPLPTEDK